MSAPPGFGPTPGPSREPNGESRMEGNFFGTLSPAEIEKKAKKWRQSQKRRFNEKRRRGGGAGIDMGKAVSGLGIGMEEAGLQAACRTRAGRARVCCERRVAVEDAFPRGCI